METKFGMKDVKFSKEALKFFVGESYSATTAQQTFQFLFDDFENIKDKSEKIKKLENLMNDPVATLGEKENAKRIIEKLIKERT